MIKFDVNKQKTIETILYVATRVESHTKHTIFKIMYFADKLHLNKYGRFITGDSYIAMEWGPVPSYAYDMTDDPPQDFNLEGYYIMPLRDANKDEFSLSDIECLDESISEHGHKSFLQLTRDSHDEAWKLTHGNSVMTIESIVNLVDDSEDLLAHLQDANP